MFGQGDGTLDEGILAGCYGSLSLTALQLYAMHKGQIFDPAAYGTAFGLIWAGAVAVMKFRKEPS